MYGFNSDNRGFSIVEVLVSAGISAIVLMASIQMISDLRAEMTRLEAKGVLLENQMTIAESFSQSATCAPQLSDSQIGKIDLSAATLDFKTPLIKEIELNKIYLGPDIGPSVFSPLAAAKGEKLPTFKNGPKVEKIYLSEFNRKSATDDTLFSAYLNIKMEQDKRTFVTKPIRIKIDFTTDNGGLSSRKIVDCKGSIVGNNSPLQTPSPTPPPNNSPQQPNKGTAAGFCQTHDVECIKTIGGYHVTNFKMPNDKQTLNPAIFKQTGFTFAPNFFKKFPQGACECEDGWTPVEISKENVTDASFVCSLGNLNHIIRNYICMKN